MTKEELEKEAEEYATENYEQCIYDDVIGWQTDYEARKQAYLAGAEPREKRIEELIALINAERERQEKCDDVHLRTIADLEKENAELKRQLEMSNKVYNDNLDYSHHIEEQLTKAKEIIREFMKYEINEYDGSLEIHFEELKKQAEQFLNEVEK